MPKKFVTITMHQLAMQYLITKISLVSILDLIIQGLYVELKSHASRIIEGGAQTSISVYSPVAEVI